MTSAFVEVTLRPDLQQIVFLKEAFRSKTKQGHLDLWLDVSGIHVLILSSVILNCPKCTRYSCSHVTGRLIFVYSAMGHGRSRLVAMAFGSVATSGQYVGSSAALHQHDRSSAAVENWISLT